jgi:hypothetical protein
VGARTEVHLEDGFKDKLQRPLHHAVADAGDLKYPDFSVLLGNIYPAVRLGFIPVSEKVVSYLRKEALRPTASMSSIGDISSTSFPRRAPRASPVDPSSLVPYRR